ncbi:hypothetical protein NDA01_28750 [Trichocoleus desertorum AS-A10]|uniref:hypothetical protein n=1 Tax=Trichocoleus desertorum TaxID=1481672 RepID=UPI0032978DA3
MNYLICWALGFSTLWVGLKLFDDEVILIVSIFVGIGFILAGLIAAPSPLQIPIEIASVIALFNVCMQCIQRGDRS